MTRTILTALDLIEENLKFIRQQLESDPLALNAVSGFHGAQEILRTHAIEIKPELPDVLRDKSVLFLKDLINCNLSTTEVFYHEITEDGSSSNDTDVDLYLHFAALVRGVGDLGASFSFEGLSEVEWIAFQDMYATAMRDLRKKTVEVPELMVSYYTSHHVEGIPPQFVVSGFAYPGLLNDNVAVYEFLDEVRARMNQERLSDGTVFDGFVISCPELEQYQSWVLLTEGFPQGVNQVAQNTPTE